MDAPRPAIAAAATPVLLAAAVLLLVLGAEASGDRLIQHSMVELLALLVVVVGTYVFVGNSGILSFGHIAFMAIGAYATAWLTLPLPLKRLNMPGLPGILHEVSLPVTPSVALAGVLAGLVGLASGLALLRLSGIAASIATLALLAIVNVGFSNWDRVTLGTSSIVGLPPYGGLMTAAWAVAAILAAFAFQSSSTGLMLRAARDDEVAAKAAGIKVLRVRLAAWTLSAMLVGAGGALYAHLLGTISIDAFWLDMTFITLAMLVVGGMQSLTGAVVGVVTITLLVELLRQVEGGIALGPISLRLPPGAQEIGIALTMLAILLVRPRGLCGNHEIGWPRRSRRKDKGQGWADQMAQGDKT
jgi:branched-chain amino acid transport system permease protein